MVKATFKMRRVLISSVVSPRLVFTICSSGAKLNHTTKVMKKAIQLRCKTFILPVNENSENFELSMY
jgi:hypothetical protein